MSDLSKSMAKLAATTNELHSNTEKIVRSALHNFDLNIKNSTAKSHNTINKNIEAQTVKTLKAVNKRHKETQALINELQTQTSMTFFKGITAGMAIVVVIVGLTHMTNLITTEPLIYGRWISCLETKDNQYCRVKD